MALTKQDFDKLDETARVRVRYSSPRITNFDQTFSRTEGEGVEKVSEGEWLRLWATYHDYEAEDVVFELA